MYSVALDSIYGYENYPHFRVWLGSKYLWIEDELGIEIYAREVSGEFNQIQYLLDNVTLVRYHLELRWQESERNISL